VSACRIEKTAAPPDLDAIRMEETGYDGERREAIPGKGI
jgi:hypothetical protein